METKGNLFVVNIFLRFFDLLALIINSLIFSIVVFFFEVNVKSINETLGVGTLIAVPSNFPFKLGRTKA